MICTLGMLLDSITREQFQQMVASTLPTWIQVGSACPARVHPGCVRPEWTLKGRGISAHSDYGHL